MSTGAHSLCTKNRGDERRPRSINKFIFEANTGSKQDTAWIDDKRTTLVPLQNLIGINPNPVAHCTLSFWNKMEWLPYHHIL